jgi:hypothetical protein
MSFETWLVLILLGKFLCAYGPVILVVLILLGIAYLGNK